MALTYYIKSRGIDNDFDQLVSLLVADRFEVFLNFNTTKVDACFINSNNRFSNKRMDECQQASYNQINASREGSKREKSENNKARWLL